MTANEQETLSNLTGTTTSFLLKLVTDEIARDGGACLATTLKDYVIDSQHPLDLHSQQRKICHKSKKRRNQQLNSLLVHSNVGKPKLLAFLESHPTIFCVRRNTIPHWVQLVEAPSSSSKLLPSPQSFPQRESLQTNVFQKALYVLRKRQARIDRRKTKSSDTDVSGIIQGKDEGVFLHWLLRQCCWEFHFLLRHCGFYMDQGLCGYHQPSDVKQVGTREWETVVLHVFEAFLRKAKERDASNDNRYSWIRVWEGKAWLEQASSEEEYQKQQGQQQQFEDVGKFDFIVRPAEGDSYPSECEEKIEDIGENSSDTNKEDAMLNLVRRIDQTLTDIVCRKDGGHQVSLSLLLHRHPDLKELLGGRDLWSLYCEFSKDDQVNLENNDSSLFSSISMFYNGANLILRSKQSKTMDGNDIGGCNDKRMMVDEEGLYSVTNNKWGRAMSNLVIQACRQKNLFGDQQDSIAAIETEGNPVTEESKSESATKTMIDLTASVGGMTLGLAKANYFDRVIALEIEQGRAVLCKENLSRHGFHDVLSSSSSTKSLVEVRNQDSVKQIPFLPRGACFVIDPPWGGYDYKQMVRRHQAEGSQGLKLGDTSLEDVLGLMAKHNSPCVVGLRLPTNFAAKDFLHALRETHQDMQFECLTRRKISVQLFMVLYFPPQAH